MSESAPPHVLLVTSLHHGGDRTRDLCQARCDLVTSTERLGGLMLAVARSEVGQLTRQGQHYQWGGDQALVAYCRQCRPDMVVFDPVPLSTASPNPSSLALAYVAWKLDIPVVCLLRGGDVNMCRWVDEYYPMCAHVVMADGLCPVYQTPAPHRYSWNWCPVLDTDQDQDVGIGAVRASAAAVPGTVAPDSVQEHVIRELERRGVAVIGMSQENGCESCCSVDVGCRPAVVINPFSWRHRLLYELCASGSLVVDTVESSLWRWLVPGREYLLMTDVSETADQIMWYMRHDEDRAQIAEAGSRRVRSWCTAQSWWTKLFFQVFGPDDVLRGAV